MNDAKKAAEIGRLAADTSDEVLTTTQLAQIADMLWPSSKAYHMPFLDGYISTICGDN